jgi:hypothetical protein
MLMHSNNTEKGGGDALDSSDKPKNDLDQFLQKARSLQEIRTKKISILAPYRDRIMFAYENKITLTTILKTLEAEGIKTSYDNLRAYIFRQKKRKN